MNNIIKSGQTILFQGDSITDCGRDRKDLFSLGNGYPKLIASYINMFYPSLNIQFINKGISADRTTDLVDRWTEDCISLNPDIVSILIGINDTGHKFERNKTVTIKEYYNNYYNILNRVKNELGSKIIILEPFAFSYPENIKSWRTDLDPKIHATRSLAADFDAIYIPLDGFFASVCTIKPSQYWSEDGIHPTKNGHSFIAKEWLKALNLIQLTA